MPTAGTMKEYLVHHNGQELESKLVDSSVPEPQDHEVLIKVVVAGTNPKDWKVPKVAATGATAFAGMSLEAAKGWTNQGDDIAGVVEKVGRGVLEFKPGDRVAAFHQMEKPHGAWAEYAIAWDHTTFHLPDNTSFEEAATIPLAGLTASISLFYHLQVPTPWAPATRPFPIFINGGASAVGSFAIKLAQLANLHPILTTAGRGIDYVRTLLDPSKGDIAVDYRQDEDAVVRELVHALEVAGNPKIKHAVDPIVIQSGVNVCRQVLDADEGHVNFILPPDVDVGPLKSSTAMVATAHYAVGDDEARALGLATSRWFTWALRSGQFTGHPFEVRKGGLNGLDSALRDLEEGKNSAVKYVVRIVETPGVGF